MTQMLLNTRNPLAARLLCFLLRHRIPGLARLWGIVLGCDIAARLPRRIVMPHPYGIIIHGDAVLGENLVILHQVTIGARNTDNQAPVIEDDVFIGAGAKVVGGVRLGRGARIGANAVVTRDVPAGATVVGYNQLLAARES
jgi:serine O-acetyltransferase